MKLQNDGDFHDFIALTKPSDIEIECLTRWEAQIS